VTGFQTIMDARSDYKDVASRLQIAKLEQRRHQQYESAMERYRASDWSEAVNQLEG
jgi:hypothetical protein